MSTRGWESVEGDIFSARWRLAGVLQDRRFGKQEREYRKEGKAPSCFSFWCGVGSRLLPLPVDRLKSKGPQTTQISDPAL